MSGDIKIAGLSSGIPFDELMAQMLEAEKYQAKKLEAWRKTWEDKIDALRDLNSRVNSLQTVNNTLKIASSFISRLASSTETRVADITVDSSVNIGTIQLDVAGKVNHKIGSTGFRTLDPDDPPLIENDGVIQFSVGNNHNLEIDLSSESAPLTLNELVDKINNDASLNSHVTASIETLGTISRFVLTSNIAGTAGAIKIHTDTTELKLGESSTESTFFTTNSDKEIVPFDALHVGSNNYTGHVSTTINFSIINNSQITWTDTAAGTTGTINIPENAEPGDQIEVTKGITIELPTDFNKAEIIAGRNFSLNVFASDIQLAQDKGLAQSAQVESIAKWNSPKDLVSTSGGVFAYSYAGNVHVVTVNEDTTLERLVGMINESPENPGVQASILNDGKGGYSLVLTGFESGAANQIKILDDSEYGDSVFTESDFFVNRQATNAIISLNDSGRWIQRSTNLITDLIDGASIRIKDSGTTIFNITTDQEDMADKIQSFVDEYNAILEYIDEITKVVLNEDGEANIGSAGVLVGNYAVNMLRSALRTFIGSRASGFDANDNMFSLLTQIGLKSNSDTKRLDFDKKEFIEALNSNERDVVRLFSADSDATINSRGFSIEPGFLGFDNYRPGNYNFNVSYNANGTIQHVSMTDPTTNETYTSDNSNEPRQIRISEDGKSFSIHVGGIRNMIINNVQLDGKTDVNSFTVNVKDGKAKSFDEELNKLFDETTGITKVLEKNYESIIKNIDKRIQREYMRVLQVQKRLEIRFARLEVNLGNLNGQMERLQQQMRQLPSGM